MQTDGHGSAAKRQRTTEFDHPLFLRWLRLLLVSFYKDEELVIADFLGQHAALVKDTVIAHILGLQERQLRQVVERRLVPDCLVEQKVDGTTSKTTYRISPMAIVMTGKRLQTMEDGPSCMCSDQHVCQPWRFQRRVGDHVRFQTNLTSMTSDLRFTASKTAKSVPCWRLATATREWTHCGLSIDSVEQITGIHDETSIIFFIVGFVFVVAIFYRILLYWRYTVYTQTALAVTELITVTFAPDSL